eukprot:2965761-Pleurochrysis_carterae.AAC.3
MLSRHPILLQARKPSTKRTCIPSFSCPQRTLFCVWLGPARQAPGSIRAVYGTDNIKKAAHGSLSASAAYRELKFFFPKARARPCPLPEPHSGQSALCRPPGIEAQKRGSATKRQLQWAAGMLRIMCKHSERNTHFARTCAFGLTKRKLTPRFSDALSLACPLRP